MKIRELNERAEKLIETGRSLEFQRVLLEERKDAAVSQLSSAYSELYEASRKDEDGEYIGDVDAAQAQVQAARDALAYVEEQIRQRDIEIEENKMDKKQAVSDISQMNDKEQRNLNILKELQKRKFSANANAVLAELIGRMNSGESTKDELLKSMGMGAAGVRYSAGESVSSGFGAAPQRAGGSGLAAGGNILGQTMPKSNMETEKTQKKEDEGRYESGIYSTYEERIRHTPQGENGRGMWTGKRGESKFIPADDEIKAILKQFNLDGIIYKDGIPDFSKCSKLTIEIANMTQMRGINRKQCDEKCAKIWNKKTGREVEKWRADNKYTWHERNDMKTCDLVLTKIHRFFGHLGGVAECKKRDGGDEFDE